MRRILGMFSNSLHRLAARHVEHVGDRLAVVADGERLGIVALAAAGVALDPHVGQEVHLDAELAVALALFAAPAGHVEAEPPRRVAAELRLGQLGVERADQIEHAGEGGRVRGRRLAQRLLIDADHLVDLLDAADRVVGAGEGAWRDAACGPASVEHVLDQRALAAAADARDDGERAQRNPHVDVLEVVVAGADGFPASRRVESGKWGVGSGLRVARLTFAALPAFAAATSHFPLFTSHFPLLASAGSSARGSPSCRTDTAR